MNIFKHLLVTFAILIVQIICHQISEDEETKLDSIEYLALDANFTDAESLKSFNYESLAKSSLESNPNYKENSNAKDPSDSKYFTQSHNPTNSKFDLSEDKNQNYEEKLDSLTTENIETKSMKYQLRGLKSYKSEDNKQYDHASAKHERTDRSNKHENLITNLGMKMTQKVKSFRSFLENLNIYEHFLKEEFFNIMETFNKKVQVGVIHMDEDYFSVLLELGIDPFNLGKPVNPEITVVIENTCQTLVVLMSVDIQINFLPSVLYQTVYPVIKEKLLPLLEKPNIKRIVEKFNQNNKFPRLFNILNESIGLSEDFDNDYTISNFFRLVDIGFKDVFITFDSEINKVLAKLYENKIKLLLELLEKDWKENDAPVSFIYYLKDKESMEEGIFYLYRILRADLILKLGYPDRQSQNQYLTDLKTAFKDEL